MLQKSGKTEGWLRLQSSVGKRLQKQRFNETKKEMKARLLLVFFISKMKEMSYLRNGKPGFGAVSFSLQLSSVRSRIKNTSYPSFFELLGIAWGQGKKAKQGEFQEKQYGYTKQASTKPRTNSQQIPATPKQHCCWWSHPEIYEITRGRTPNKKTKRKPQQETQSELRKREEKPEEEILRERKTQDKAKTKSAWWTPLTIKKFERRFNQNKKGIKRKRKSRRWCWWWWGPKYIQSRWSKTKQKEEELASR